MRIVNLEIGGSAPVAIVAEVGNAHNGSLERAHRIIAAIKASGASAAKFQCYLPSELVALRGDGPAPEPWGSQGWTMLSLYEKAQTPHAWFPELVQHCNSIGLPWFSSVFGPKSFQLLEYLDCSAYKLAALDCYSESLYEMVDAVKKPVLRSVRNEDQSKCRDWQDGGLMELYAPEGYPQVEIHLREMRSLDGFSYHGTDFMVPVYAVAAGARILEVHVQLDDEPSELEANVSLTMTQLAKLVAEVRRVEGML